MKIKLQKFLGGEAYFEIVINRYHYDTSREISNILNLNIDVYSDILIKEVIKHNFHRYCDIIDEFNLCKDTIFKLRDVSEEVYIERFKEAFADQLTLLVLKDG